MFLDKHFHKLFVVLIVFSLSLVTYFWHTEAAQNICTENCVQIGGLVIPVEVADDFESRRIGLSYRETLAEDAGMLFVMPDKQRASFWMKDMNFPLDIVWIYDNKIVNIHENLAPEGSQPVNSYSSKFPINYVLELNGGFVARNGVEVGDEIIIKN